MKKILSGKTAGHRRSSPLLAGLAVVAAGVISSPAQALDPDQVTNLWFDWMANVSFAGPRLFIRTDRDVIQTGPTSASFQRGRSQFVLADGGVNRVWRDQIVPFFDEWDTDRDGWRDVVENTANPATDPFDPTSFPANIAPDVFWTILANGRFLPINPAGATPALLVRPFSGSNVVVSAGPAASRLPRPTPFTDYSSQFYIVNPGAASPELYGLSLYSMIIDYPTPGDVGRMENDVVPGAYQVQFPTVSNPFATAGTWVNHIMAPNGSFTLGLKKPTWLLRSAEAIETINKPPVKQKWVNGRLQFDPEIPTIFKWDDIVSAGIASGTNDQITVRLEDEDQNMIWPPVGGGAVLSAASPQITLSFLGLLPEIGPGNAQPPASINAFLVLRYARNVNAASSGDVSSVTLRVPIELIRSYASWRLAMFPGAAGLDDSVSGPGADPDGDGLTNFQEYQLGSDPRKATIGAFDAFAEDITATTATLGGTIDRDPFAPVPATIFERGVIYSASFTNPFPLLDGPGVNRVVSSPPDDGEFSVAVTGLTDGTQYSFRAYTISSLGTFYSSPVATFSTPVLPPLTLPTVTSPASSSVSGTTATLGGTIANNGGSNISQTGVVYSVTTNNDNPFIGGPGVTRINGAGVNSGSFTVNATGLQPSTTYSFRAFATNGVGTSHTSEIGTFTTAALPTITSPTATNITSSSATLGGNVTSGGGLAVLQRGIVFSPTNTTPTIGGANTIAFAASTTGLGVFTVNATGLAANTLYRYRAYAINAVGTSYTTVGTFTTTGAIPTLANPTIANLTSTSVTLGASVTSDGQSPILERGFVYSPTAVNNNPVDGGPGVIKFPVAGTTGTFTANITGLTPNTGYTFKAFARNATGTAYAAPFAFFTTFPPLTVTSPTATDITATGATLGGTVQSDGVTTVTARGVVFSTDPAVAPVLGGPGVTAVTGTGSMGTFTVNVTGLDSDTDYFFRPYATNNAGTSYSEVSLFRTLPLQLLGLSQFEWLEPAEEVEEAGEMLLLAAESSPEDDNRRTRGLRSSADDANSSPDGGSQVTRSPRGIRTADSVSPGEPTTGGGNSGRAPFIPRFVYRKHESELSEPFTYQIESSADAMTWQTLDESLWEIQHAPETLEATWISSEPPPTRIFFRVKGILD